MIITSELLDKYYNGDCNPEEKQAVEKWLNDTQPVSEQEDEHLAEAWKEISIQVNSDESFKETGLPRIIKFRSYFTSISKYVAAACLLATFISAAFLMFYNSSKINGSVVLENKGKTSAKKTQIDGLSFTIAPESKAEVTTSLIGNKLEVGFCGIIEIKNESNEMIGLDLYSDCLRPACKKQIVKCEKGRRYLAINSLNRNCDKVIVIAPCDIKNLPAKIRWNVMKDFKI